MYLAKTENLPLTVMVLEVEAFGKLLGLDETIWAEPS